MSWKVKEGQGKVMDGLFTSLDWHFRCKKFWVVVVVVWVACRIIVSAPVPVPFLWTLDFGFGTWIWDLDLGLGFGTGLGLDNYIVQICTNLKYRNWFHMSWCATLKSLYILSPSIALVCSKSYKYFNTIIKKNFLVLVRMDFLWK